MSAQVKMVRVSIGAGAVIAVCVGMLFLVRPVPDAVVSALGGPAGGVERIGGYRVRYRPPRGLDPAELARRIDRATVQRDGDALVLELPGLAEGMAPELTELLAGGGLEMHAEVMNAFALVELRGERWLTFGVLVALVPAWSYLLARPRLVEPVAGAAGLPAPSWRTWRRATLVSAALLISVHGFAALALESAPGATALATPILAMVGAAVVLDVIDGARAHRRRLAPAGVLHQIQHASVVERVLSDAGIPCHLHARHLRTLLAFFGPFAPVIVLVPEPLAAQARLALEAVVAAAAVPDADR